ncbi:MAG: hypothetical protein KKF46_02790 [Nanoarchaeota archaeon]|nr:hypothetical protein [Nanoarchaeota archaeon]MBU1321259.1 hypothetical protein [Nanoarchaeota archaeon]MBU1597330.1 hypothetical protein [Nanoarchaeota archaeon]MBU2441453.1 hypothetical protein [Nanoarchaeota archaeon]
MTDLVACLSTGKGTWTNVLQLVKKEEFTNVFLIVNDWAKDNLKLERANLHVIVVDANSKLQVIRGMIIAGLKDKVKGLEVAVNIDSGSGKEHTAILSALINLGFALRFVSFENEEIIEI